MTIPWWIKRLAGVLGIPLTVENVRFLTAWSRAEGGTAKNNWLNTTYVLAWGSSPYNHLSSGGGVQNYAQPVGGVCAIALTLATSHRPDGSLTYGHLLGDLQSGNHTAEEILERNRTVLPVWGTNPDVIAAVLKEIPAA